MSLELEKLLKTQKRYRLISDNDGHNYIIPADQVPQFEMWVTCMDMDEYTIFDFEDCRMNVNNLTFIDPQGWK